MTVFVDTSALYALVDEDDVNHETSAAVWDTLLDAERLLTHTYVVVEISALLQHRLGMGAAEQLHAALLPVVQVRAVDRGTHDRAVTRWRQQARRELSLVDVTSFVVMEDLAIRSAFAFDDDFTAEGFHLAT